MSIKEVADYLGVEYKTVYRLVQSGELPAGRIGGVFRIRRSDVDQFFEEQKEKTMKEARLSSGLGQRCSYCQEVIVSLLGFQGQCEECGEPLCTKCWRIYLRHHCKLHDKSLNLQESPKPAPPKAVSGGVEEKGFRPKGEARLQGPALLVSNPMARQREMDFIQRFDQKIKTLKEIAHPLDGRTLKVKSWEAHHARLDDKARLYHLIPWRNRDKVLPFIPLNVRSRYALTGGSLFYKKKSSSPLIIEAYSYSHLPSFIHDGFDMRAASLSDLLVILNESIEEAQRAKAYYILGLASTTGWEKAAREHCQSFSNPCLSLCLVDLQDKSLSYNLHDERLRPFLPLFSFEGEEDEEKRVEEYVKEAFVTRQSLALSEVSKALRVGEGTVERVFKRLARSGSFALDRLDGIGLVISEKT